MNIFMITNFWFHQVIEQFQICSFNASDNQSASSLSYSSENIFESQNMKKTHFISKHKQWLKGGVYISIHFDEQNV